MSKHIKKYSPRKIIPFNDTDEHTSPTNGTLDKIYPSDKIYPLHMTPIAGDFSKPHIICDELSMKQKQKQNQSIISIMFGKR